MENYMFSVDMVKKYPVLRKWNDGQRTLVGDGREQELLDYIRQRPDFEELKGHPRRIVAAIDDFGNHEKLLITIISDKGRILADLIAKNKPLVMVELGGYVGYSAMLFADQMRTSAEIDRKVHYWSLELEQNFATVARELIDIAGLSDVVTVVVGSSSDSLQQLKDDGSLKQIDLLYLDHNEDQLYEKDTRLCEELGLFVSGSRIVADNVLLPGAPQYREYVRSNGKFHSVGVKGLIIPGELEDELEVTTVL